MENMYIGIVCYALIPPPPHVQMLGGGIYIQTPVFMTIEICVCKDDYYQSFHFLKFKLY